MVGKLEGSLEGDLFPRGAVRDATPRVQKRNGQTLFGPQLKRPRIPRPTDPTSGKSDQRHGAGLNLSYLSVGVTVIGLVTKADRSSIELVLTGDFRGYVATDEYLLDQNLGNIEMGGSDEDSSKYSSDEEAGSIRQAWEVVSVGDVLPAAVLNIEQTSSGKKIAKLSLKPHLVNLGLNPSLLLSKNFWAYGAVKSVEDHGSIISFGSNIPHTGFLPFENDSKSPDTRMVPGSPIVVVTTHAIKTSSKQRRKASSTVRVSASKVNVLQTVVDVEGKTFQDLRAGMLIRCKVLREGRRGLLLSARSIFNVAVDSSHIPRKSDGSWDVTPGNDVLARLLFVDPARKSIGASLLPCLVNCMSPREVPPLWKIGTRLKSLSVERVEPGFGLRLRSGEKGPRNSADDIDTDMRSEEMKKRESHDASLNVPIFAHISRISDLKALQLESRFQNNSVLADGARVVSIYRFDGVVNVDLRPSVLQRKVLSLDEVEVGTVYDCKILSHTTMGSLMVAVDGDPYLPGVVLPTHISDIPISSKRLAKNPSFRIGATIKCRALSVNWDKQKSFLTVRKSLVSPKYPVLTSYDEAADALKQDVSSSGGNAGEKECSRFTGVVKAITQQGSVLVEFCDKVQGIVPASRLCIDRCRDFSHLETEKLYPMGDTVHVRVLQVDPKKRRILLSMNLDVCGDERDGKRTFQIGQRVKATISAVNTDLKHFVATAHALDAGEARDSLESSGATDRSLHPIDCHIPFGHLSDTTGMADRLADEIQLRLETSRKREAPDLEVSEAMVLCHREQVPVLTMKASLIEAEALGRLPKSFRDVHSMKAVLESKHGRSSLLRGYVKALLPTGIIVGFLGECVGFVRNSRVADRFVSDPARFLKMNQSICATIESTDESAGRFYLSIRASDVGSTGIEADTISLFRSTRTWQEIFGIKPIHGEFPVGEIVEATVNSVSTYGVKYDLKSRRQRSLGVAYGINGTSADVVIGSKLGHEPASQVESILGDTTRDPVPGHVERVRILDVDPLTNVVDLSRDEDLLSQGKKKCSLKSTAVLNATVLLMKNAYVILAVKVSKSRTAIAYGLGPITHEDLLIRPGVEVKCLALDNTQADKRRNLVMVDWESFRSTTKEARTGLKGDSECMQTIAMLQASAGEDHSSLIGMRICGKVTRKFKLHAYVAIAPGIVGQIHITNTSSTTPTELSELRLGAAPSSLSSNFSLPEPGRKIKLGYFAGLRRATDATVSDPLVVEMSMRKENCTVQEPCLGDKFIGFIKRLSSRMKEEPESDLERELSNQTLIAMSPTRLLSCADVDCLFDETVALHEGTPVVAQVIGLSEDGKRGGRCTFSPNGESNGDAFLGLVKSVHPGRGLRVAIPWHARPSFAKTVPWGFVDICEIANDYDRTVDIMTEVQPGSVVKIYDLSTTSYVKNEGKHHVRLSMRNPSEDKLKDPLLTNANLGSFAAGSHVRGFIQGIGKKGCFVSLGRDIVAQVKLCDLSDEFVKDLEVEFPRGKLVSGVAHKVAVRESGSKISLVLRKRPRKKLQTAPLSADLKEGSTVSGMVKRVAGYGALVEISPNVSALLHKSEADQDRFIKDPSVEWTVGQKLTAIIIELKDGKINIGTKRCYFEAAGYDETSIDELLAKNCESRNLDSTGSKLGSEEEIRVIVSDTKESHQVEEEIGDDDASDLETPTHAQDVFQFSSEAAPSFNTLSQTTKADFEDSLNQKRPATALDVLGGFDFANVEVGKTDVDSKEQSKNRTTASKLVKHPSEERREKNKERRAEEKEIRLREEALANNRNAPATAEDFERLLLGEPDSSVLWIRYMAFCVGLAQIDKARSIAERALEAINLQKEADRVNVWCAYVNLEAQFGSTNTGEFETGMGLEPKRAAAVFRVFERACERITNVKSFHMQISSALRRSFPELADEVLHRGLRRFRDSVDLWIATGQALYARNEIQSARKTLEKALITLDKREHIRLVTKFAQYEYRYGQAERGRTVFESLVGNFPKRLDLWNIYLDMELTQCTHAETESRDDVVRRTRHLFERFTSLDLNSKKMKFAFKKWLRFEKSHGTRESEFDVKSRAQTYVNNNVSK